LGSIQEDLVAGIPKTPYIFCTENAYEKTVQKTRSIRKRRQGDRSSSSPTSDKGKLTQVNCLERPRFSQLHNGNDDAFTITCKSSKSCINQGHVYEDAL
jgi:hypothetical protein